MAYQEIQLLPEANRIGEGVSEPFMAYGHIEGIILALHVESFQGDGYLVVHLEDSVDGVHWSLINRLTVNNPYPPQTEVARITDEVIASRLRLFWQVSQQDEADFQVNAGILYR